MWYIILAMCGIDMRMPLVTPLIIWRGSTLSFLVPVVSVFQGFHGCFVNKEKTRFELTFRGTQVDPWHCDEKREHEEKRRRVQEVVRWWSKESCIVLILVIQSFILSERVQVWRDMIEESKEEILIWWAVPNLCLFIHLQIDDSKILHFFLLSLFVILSLCSENLIRKV